MISELQGGKKVDDCGGEKDTGKDVVYVREGQC